MEVFFGKFPIFLENVRSKNKKNKFEKHEKFIDSYDKYYVEKVCSGSASWLLEIKTSHHSQTTSSDTIHSIFRVFERKSSCR